MQEDAGPPNNSVLAARVSENENPGRVLGEPAGVDEHSERVHATKWPFIYQMQIDDPIIRTLKF